jgi:hypothetical protein
MLGTRSRGVTVSTLDFESNNPGSIEIVAGTAICRWTYLCIDGTTLGFCLTHRGGAMFGVARVEYTIVVLQSNSRDLRSAQSVSPEKRLLGLLVTRLVDRYLTICSTTLDARPIARYSIHSRERGHHGRREEPLEGTDAEATSGERRGDGFRGSIRTVPESGEVTIRRA